MAAPVKTSVAQCLFSVIRLIPIKVAALYAMTGMNILSLYSEANTVAAANATVVCPEGKRAINLFAISIFSSS